MTKKLMLGAALSALMVSGALAQAPPAPTSPSTTPPAATEPAKPDAAAPAAKPDTATKPDDSAAKPDTAASSDAAKKEFVASQKPDQWLSSKFKGTDVVGSDDKKIGDVSDILFDKNGKIEAFVVSVGGFLGMGAKDVAMPPAAFEVVAGDKSKGEADKLKVTMSQEELKSAQNFEPYQPPRATTTGSGSSPMGGSSRAPMGGGGAR
jgi:hypothetical protein